MVNLGESIKEYLRNEVMLLETDTAPRNNSTDIIESIFGKFKDSKSPNKLNGITRQILFLPIYTKLKNTELAKEFDSKGALEDIRIGDIDAWAKKNLTQNLVQLRRKHLQKAG